MSNSCAKKERTLRDPTFEVTNMCNVVNLFGSRKKLLFGFPVLSPFSLDFTRV